MRKTTSLEIDNYLDELREPGQYDSEGQFTVSGLRAVGTLAQSLLQTESDWILKFVQCACAADCQELRIDQTRSATQIHFVLPYALKLTDLERALVSPQVCPDMPGLDDLTTGLRAVGIGQKRDWVTKLSTGSVTALISCVEGEVSADRRQLENPVGDVTDVVVGVSYPQGESGKLGGVIRFGPSIQREHEALLKRARCCPIPFFLDGKRLDDVAGIGSSEVLENKSFLGIFGIPEEGAHTLRIPQGVIREQNSKIEDRFASQAPFFVSRFPQSGSVSSIQCWHFNYTNRREQMHKSDFFFQPVPTPSRLHLVRRGVLVGSRFLGFHHPVSIDVFLQADHLRSDLTGLRVTSTDTEIEQAKDEIKRADEFLRGLLSELKGHQSLPRKSELLLYGGLGALGLMFPPLALKAVAGTFTTLMLAKAAHNHKLVVKECIRQLEDIQGRLLI